jgi:hypothetical protein
MKAFSRRVLHGLVVSILLGNSLVWAQDPTFPAPRGAADLGEPPPVPGDDSTVPPIAPGIEVQVRGPVHEAFARPSEMAPPPSPVIARRPPDPVPEVPPDRRPEGDNVVWVPGYWAWDAERSDFLWVSGVWRVPPPGRKWLQGSWHEVDGGWQWTSGIWAADDTDTSSYLPEPPGSLDNGPASPAPNENAFYVPGSWNYRTDQYVWRPGYWSTARPGWIWTPSTFVCTPSGYLFCSGYWDYPLESRGLLFAPVVFTQPLWQTPGWVYQPSYFVAAPVLTGSLFVGPASRGYYFGSYYGPSWRNLGYRPWFAARSAAGLYGYYSWTNRAVPGWAAGVRTTFEGRSNGTLARPPATFAEHSRFLAAGGAGAARRAAYGVTSPGQLSVVRPLSHAPNQIRLTQAQVNVERQRALSIHGSAAQAHAGVTRRQSVSVQGQVNHFVGPTGHAASAAGSVHYSTPNRQGSAAGGVAHYSSPGHIATAAGSYYFGAHRSGVAAANGVVAGGSVHHGTAVNGVAGGATVHYGASHGGPPVHHSPPGGSVSASARVGFGHTVHSAPPAARPPVHNRDASAHHRGS